MPTLDRITLYPVKSLDGIHVEEARVLPSGGLEFDRRWRLAFPSGWRCCAVYWKSVR